MAARPEADAPIVAPPPLARAFSSDEARALAEANGLLEIGKRPPLRKYVRSLVDRWAFIRVLASSKAYARNQNSYLGQMWAVLTPLLNAAVFILIFGILLKTTRGLENAIAFIVVGTFMYRFFDHSVTAGSRSIKKNSNLVRSLHFPRAVLPASTVLAELASLVPALVVMCLIAWSSGALPKQGAVPITWRLLLLPAAVLLMWLFNTGCALIAARAVAITPDLENLLPFVLRLGMYASGVIFSIERIASGTLELVLHYQPVAVYLYLARSTILNEPTITMDGTMWLWGCGWALVFFVGGFLFFWRGEERYGRD